MIGGLWRLQVIRAIFFFRVVFEGQLGVLDFQA